MTTINKEIINSLIIDVSYKHLVLTKNDVPKFVCGTCKLLFPEIDTKCEEDNDFYLVCHRFKDYFIFWKFRKKPFVLIYFLKNAMSNIDRLVDQIVIDSKKTFIFNNSKG